MNNANVNGILNGKLLNQIAHKSRTSEVVAISLALRDRLRHKSDITRMRNALVRQGEHIVEIDYMQFWKDLEAAGIGEIKWGRSGRPDEFIWHFSLKKVAAAMLDGKDVKANEKPVVKVADKPNTLVRKAEKPSPVQAAQPPVQEKSLEVKPKGDRMVFISLRPGVDIEISLPVDLRKDESEVISRAIARMAH